MGFIPGPTDPFYQLMVPPVDETPAQKTARLKREQDAQRANDQIEEELKQQKAKLKKEKGIINVLLLGQAESGKSTTLKNFRMRYAQAEWERERNGWRAVVQLNVVKTMNIIIRVVEEELNGENPPISDNDSDPRSLNVFGDRHRLLIIRLTSLKAIEAELRRRIGAGTEDITPSTNTSNQVTFPETDNGDIEEVERIRPPRITEATVRSWIDVLLPGGSSMDSTASISDDVTATLANCKDDMKALWEDKVVKRALQTRRLRLSDTSGFFLKDLDRIAAHNYVVTDNDIVRARLRTTGIQEYRLTFPQGREGAWQWRIYDVGGCRTLRKAWLPYFHNVNVIIFLAPISVFDQRLEEDPRENRLDDSIKLWSFICGSRLLGRSQLILFLNKCDLLRRKLERGVHIAEFLPSYRDRPNKATDFVKHMREIFKDIQKENSPFPESRHTYIYPTTVTDTASTGKILESVRDGVLRENLSASQLI